MAVTSNFDNLVELVNDLVTADKMKLSEAIYRKVFDAEDMTSQFTVIPGVRNGNIVPILSNSPNYAKFPYKDPTACTLPTCDTDLDFAPKVWDLGTNACRNEICVNGFDDNFLLFFGQFRRVFGDADIDTGIIAYVQEIIQKDLRAAIWRQGWFGDKSLSNSDPNYALLRSTNGIFTQAEAGNGYKIEVPNNTTPGDPPTGQELYELLKDAYNYAATQPWFDPTNMVWDMTAAMANILVAWLNGMGDTSAYNCDCYDPNGVVSTRAYGIDNLRIFGVQVRAHREFDGVINGLGLGYPYRALLTDKGNIVFGTSETDQLPDFRVWYSMDDNEIKIDAGFTLAPMLVVDDYVYIGAENGTTPTT